MSGGFKDEGDFDWRRFEAMAKRYWRKVSDAADTDFSGWGGNIRVGRMLASGDLRLVALYYIDQSPRHGYDLIKAVEAQSNGFYAPSPGIVYPALTFLEEAGYVTSSADGNKKLYTITDEGKAHLEENRDAVASTLDFLARTGEQMNRFREFVRADWPFAEGRPEEGNVPPHWGERPGRPDHDRPMHAAVPELEAARKALKQALKKARKGSEEQQRRAADILRRAAAEVDGLGDDEVDI